VAADAPPDSTFKVAHYNIQSGMGVSQLSGTCSFQRNSNCTDPSSPMNAWGMGVVQEELNRALNSDASVIALGLSEAWPCASPAAVQQALGWAARAGERNGVSLLARHGFAGPAEFFQLDTSLNENPNDTMWVVRAPVCADAACSRSVEVFSGHWNANGINRTESYERQARGTVEFLDRLPATEPRVLVGDFNVWEEPGTVCNQTPLPSAAQILRDGGNLDAWPAVHGTAEGYTGTWNRNGCGEPNGYLWKRLDQAWSKALPTPLNMTRFGMVTPGACAPSDHAGIVVEYAWPGDDTTSPIVSIVAPSVGSALTGTALVAATASDDSGIAKVGFTVNGVLIAEDDTAPYEIQWDTTTVANGTHVLAAWAQDGAGMRGTSANIGVSVDNAPAANTVPRASFTSDCVDLDCRFTDASTDAEGPVATWSWAFGDGTTSTTQHPTHRYAASGTYSASLTVTDSQGATSTTAQNISVAASAVIPTATSTVSGGVYNLRIATDASPDLTDLDGLIHSTTSRWTATAEKVWALYYWSHILKRQSVPIVLHGMELTDPIRNLADFGFTMCSTISGINQTLYEALGLRHQYWDICNHTVSNVEFNGRWNMVDSSMSHLVTLDDGVTLASVQEAAADSARLVRERSLYATSPNGFLTGSDTARNLTRTASPSDGSIVSGFADAFCEDGLKYRDYYYNWNAGHRQVLNLRGNESYTRYYRRLGDGPEYWVPSEEVAAPDPTQTFENDSQNRFRMRGNGAWTFSPDLTPGGWASAAYTASNVTAGGGGLMPASAGQPAEIVYKVQAANIITSQQIHAQFSRTNPLASANISVSLNHGLTWTAVGTVDAVGAEVPFGVTLREEVSGAYETLVRIAMHPGSESPDGIALTDLRVDTITQVNAKSLPKLNVGRNEIFVGAGDQSDTMVLWPDLRGDFWKKDAYASSNIASRSVPTTYTAVAYPAVLTQDAYLVYRMDAPADITRVVYGGRLHNFAPGSYIDFLHSLDNGATWTRSYRLSDTSKPYDVIHYETVTAIPFGVRTVLFKYLIHNTNTTAARAAGLYSVRMEAAHRPSEEGIKPLDVTLRWKEVRADRTLVERSHRQRITELPTTYVLNVGGSDHPVMESMRMSLADDADTAPFGYGDGLDAGGERFVHVKRVEGTNLAKNKPYTISRPPSSFQSSAGPENTTILTDGIVGAPATGSTSYWWGQCWTSGSTLDMTVDLGQTASAAAFRAHLFGYPFWDALKGEVKDVVEVQTSIDGINFASQGYLNTSLWNKNVPINHMLQDDERATAWNFELTLAAPVSARYVRYRAMPMRSLCVSELQVMDLIVYEPFDIRIALPGSVEPEPEPEPEPDPNAPVVTLVEPVADTSFTAPATITLTATASDSDGTIAQVAFYSGTTLVGTATSSPYTVTWSNVAAGSYTLTARATDDDGATTTSTPVPITVTAAPSADPSATEIVLYASTAARVGSAWTLAADATAAGGARLQNPDAGAAKRAAPLANPDSYVELTFTAEAGRPYRLWLRGRAERDSWANDSIFAQFDGAVTASGSPVFRIGTTNGTWINLEDDANAGLAGWGWQDNGYGGGVLGPAIYFATTGPQRLRIQVREDGFGIDQVVLSADQYLNTAPGALKNDTTIVDR
jgi:PKD repeat protein